MRVTIFSVFGFRLPFRIAALALAGLASISSLKAGVLYTYVGPFSGAGANWNSAVNWSQNGVPGDSDIAFLGTDQTLQSGPATVNFDYAYLKSSPLQTLQLNASGSNTSITLQQSSASSEMEADTEIVGRDVLKSTYNQSAGINGCLTLYLGYDSNGGGTYVLSGGTLSTVTSTVGLNGIGTFTHSGGTHTAAISLYVAAGPKSGSYDISGSAILNAAFVQIAQDGGGTGTFTATGGTSTVGEFSFGPGGTCNLSGGILNASYFDSVTTGGGTGTLNLNGGVLRPRANETDFIRKLGHANLQAGGADIDTNGFNITIAQVLEHDAALGITADGGLTKEGAGTLTLTAANTYTGPTTVKQGTLTVNNTSGSATGTGTVTVKSGAVFGGGIGASNGGTLDPVTRSYTGSNGVISGSLVPDSGGIIAPGNSVGTLTVGGLTLNPGAVLNYELTATANDFISATTLQITGGGINLYAEGTTSPFSTPGLYHLMKYSGTLSSVSGLSVLNAVAGRTYTFANNTALKTVDVLIALAITSPTPTATATATATPTATATATPTATATATATPTATAAATATPTATATGTPTATATVTPTATATPTASPVRVANMSTRARIGSGEQVLVGGFIISGSGPKRLLLRAIGPSVTAIPLADRLADPVMEFHGADGSLITTNNDWQDTQADAIRATGMAPTNDRESAIAFNAATGPYTIVVRSHDQSSGVGLVDIYDLDPGASSKLANISARGLVLTGDDVIIGGLILNGSSGATTIVARAIGPSLAQFAITRPLADPTLEIHNADGSILQSNDNWTDDPAQAAALIAVGLSPKDPAESAIFTNLAPGSYTAIIRGKNGMTGIALVEFYNP